MRIVVAALLIAALAAGCDDKSDDYNWSDVQRAFRSQGFELVPPSPGISFRSARLPKTNEPFAVELYESDDRASDKVRTMVVFFEKVKRASASQPPLYFVLDKRNVVVVSDERVAPPVRKPIMEALDRLA